MTIILGAGSHRGVAAGSSDAIFLRDTSAFYDKAVDGATHTLLAATRNADDQLFVIKAGFGHEFAAPTGWVAFVPAFPGNNLTLYRRQATNTAADEFDISETTAGPVAAQMAVFGNTLGQTLPLSPYQSGPITTDLAGTDLRVSALPLDTPAEMHDILFSVFYKQRTFGTAAHAVSITTPSVVANVIGSIAINQPAQADDFWLGWEWEYENADSPAIPLVNVPYTPLTANTVNTTQTVRMTY